MNSQLLQSYKKQESKSPELKKSTNKNVMLFLKIVGVLALVLVVSVLYLQQLSTINYYRAEISRLNIEKKESLQKLNNLNVVVARLASFERIRRIAEEELGMVKSTDIEYVEVGGVD
jgi:cell division protein FtsL